MGNWEIGKLGNGVFGKMGWPVSRFPFTKARRTETTTQLIFAFFETS